MKRTLSHLSLPLLAALCLAGCQSAPAPAPIGGQKSPDSQFVDQMVAKAKGDPSVLTAEERARMDKITRNSTDMVIKMSAKK